jgi:hypothetical protein
MRHRYEWSLLAAVLIALGSSSARAGTDQEGLIVWEGPAVAGEATTLARALDLLPRRPARVAVVDATRARPETRDLLLRLDAFVVRDSAVVYVVRQSALLRGAIAGSSIHVHALAAAIWHEMAHVAGADEREARLQEQVLWTSFIRDQRVDREYGLRYLSALERRPDHALEARATR